MVIKLPGHHKTQIRFAVDVPHLPLLLKGGRVRRVSEGFAVVHPDGQPLGSWPAERKLASERELARESPMPSAR